MKKVLGLGNALVDIMTKIENDEILKEFSLPKGSMSHVDLDFSGKLLKACENLEKHQAAGGSAANTINGLANLGVDCGFIGKTGDDEMGEFFSNDMKKNKINPVLYKSQTGTGRVVALISPDSERTFGTYLGAAIELSANDLIESHFDGYDYFHIEGYLVQDHQLIESALKIAKKKNMIISLDLASYNVVEENLEFLHSMINQYVDIVFANEDEAKAYTGKSPEIALDEIEKETSIAVVKTGAEGSFIKTNNIKTKVGVIKVNPVDTTGAGDLYAAGFLYGHMIGLSVDKCGQAGAILAGNVIETVGPKMTEECWMKIRKEVKSLLG